MWLYRIEEGCDIAISDHFSKRGVEIIEFMKVSNDDARYK